MKLSAILPIYNEGKCLPFCLRTLLPYVDQCIIIDGSENGPSTDNTSVIIKAIKKLFPDKVVSISGVYRRDDGAWDDTAQSNIGFNLVDGDFIMRTHADIIYDYVDMARLRSYVSRFPDKKLFYCPLIEFFYDTEHIRLYGNNLEPSLPRPLVGDVPVIAKSLNPHFEDIGEYRRSCLQADPFERDDIIYMPHVKRYHFGWVKPFKEQVLKHVRYIKRGDHEVGGENLKAQGEKAIFDWAIKHVLTYKDDPSMFPYAGEYPAFAEGIRDMTSMDGYDDFMENYKEK